MIKKSSTWLTNKETKMLNDWDGLMKNIFKAWIRIWLLGSSHCP